MATPLAWHALDASAVTATLEVDAGRGLSAAEAARRLAQGGPNTLPEPARRTLAVVVLAQFASPLIYLLLAAAALAAALGHVGDAVVIGVVVALNAVIGAVQEGRAEASLRALRTLASHQARVVRDGQPQHVATAEVVVGDVLVLDAGGELAAAVYVRPEADADAEPGAGPVAGSFGMLSVAPELQGRGLGKRMIAVAEAMCAAMGCATVGVRVVNVREELPPFYRRLGYRETGTIPFTDPRVRQPCHFIEMKKALGAQA